MDPSSDSYSFSYSTADGNGTSSFSPLYLAVVNYINPIIFLFISIGGLIGNGLVIFCLLYFTNLKTVPNVYILNLAVIDFIFLLSLPFMSYQYIMRDWPFGLVICKFSVGMNTLNQYASSWTLVSMSADRFMAVVYPLSSMQRRTRSCARMVCTAVLLWSLVLSSIDWVIADVIDHQEPDRNVSFCMLSQPTDMTSFPTVYTILNFAFGFAVPLLGILFFYTSIVVIMQSNNFYFGSDAKTAAQRASKRVAVLTIAVIVVFVICWLPYYAFQVRVIMPAKTNEVHGLFHQLSIAWCYMNSIFNPFIYTFVGENFRKNMGKLCACWSQGFNRRRQSGRDSSMYTRTTNKVPLKRHQTKNTYTCGSDVTADVTVPHEHNNNFYATTVI